MHTISNEIASQMHLLQQLLDEEFQKVIAPCPTWLKEILSYYHNLGGKRLRPGFLFASCMDYGLDPTSIIPYATAVELMHTFSLFHDDVIDDAKTRRGAESIQQKYDSATAIVGGDIFHSLIHGYLTNLAVNSKLPPQDVLEFLNELALKVEVPIGTAVLEETYLARSKAMPDLEKAMSINREKTGPVFGLSAATGAMLTKNHSDIELLWEIGYDLGLAYQLIDDVVDFVDAKSGKDIGGDLREGKKTPLLVLAYEKAPSFVTELLKSEITQSHVLSFLSRFKSEFLWILVKAEDYLDKSISKIKKLNGLSKIENLSNFVLFIKKKLISLKQKVSEI